MFLVTYNILSHHLTEKKRYINSSDKDLDPENRLSLILQKLNFCVEKSAIINLQEVPLDWAGIFHQYFASKNYYLIMGHYGKSKNGYMGIGIAIPLAKFSIQRAEIQRLSDSFEFNIPGKWDLFIRELKKLPLRIQGKPHDSLNHPGLFSKKRMNQSVLLHLREISSKKEFIVVTYHMPMAYFLPEAMSLHLMMLFQYCIKMAKGLPLVISGDFNITPNSSQYRWITTGVLEETDPSYPGGLVKNLSMQLERSFQSAYRAVNSQEPEWTNYGQSEKNKPFIDTLDYIWFTSEWKAKSVLPLPSKSDIIKPLPNELEPSDHLLLGSELVLQ